MHAFLVLPHQLYDNLSSEELLQGETQTLIFIEEPMLFYDPIKRPIKPNKIKIAYMRACMRYMYDNIQIPKPNNTKKVYKSYNDVIGNTKYSFLEKYTSITMYDPTDIPLLAKYKEICKKLGIHLEVIESPNFLMSKTDMQEYTSSTKGISTRHSGYYNFVKAKLGILKDIPNMDKYNREALGKVKNDNIIKPNKQNKAYYEEAIQYTNTHFKDHIGSLSTLQNLYMYPISHKEAYQHFQVFLKDKLPNFGKYQDAISKENITLYHSCISAALNIGLLDPQRLVDMTMKYYDKNKKAIPINSLEGFIRQLIGWREYMRYLYVYHRDDMINSNIPKNTQTFTKSQNKAWYTGATGIYPLDNEIKKAISTGYAHHIVRLMVFLNFFILSGYHPYVIYKWFMEVVSIDAYDWVMVPNVYAMGYFYNKAMTRPYLSKSTYIAKMSDYKKDGKWDVTWDMMYDKFIREKPREYVFWYKRGL